jgi:lipocalin
MHLPSSANRSPREADLDLGIQLVELRLVAREQRVRRAIDDIGLQLRQSLKPRRLAISLGGTTLAVSALAWLLWRWRHRLGMPAGSATPPAGTAAAAGASDGIPWVRLVALGWPMLPEAWRARISPATASLLAGLGLPLVERLLHGHKAAPPATVEPLDLARFAGGWFVLARWPRPASGARGPGELHYLARADGHFDVVLRDGGSAAPRWGEAQIVPGSGAAKLRLSFSPRWKRVLPWAWDEHWVLHVDADYQEALVGSSRRDRLFVLSRRPTLAPQRLGALLQQARERGFAVERLRLPTDA